MTNILICTGKKKLVQKVLDHFKDLDRRKKIEVLNHQQHTKRVMMMKYEELKLLFIAYDGYNLEVPRDLVKKADNFMIRKGQRLLVSMSTFTTEDPSLRWNIISAATSYKLKGGMVAVEETVEEQNYKKLRTCALKLQGPPKMTLDLKDHYVKERIVDPKTVVYTI